jgi:glycosyltransferase involved in cell wall biosynthesis
MIVDFPIQKKKRSVADNPLFSILIPSWNNLAYLKLCVESIRKNSHFSHQIIIHINEGSDGTTSWVESQPGLDYTHTGKNIGICYALNICRQLVVTDYIVYMNDDMYACPDWDLELFNVINQIGHPYFFLSATAIEPFGSDNNCVLVMDCGRDIKSFQEKKLLDSYSSLPMEDWQGATWPPSLVHKDIWDLAGGYSTEFSPGMYSDPDFSMKLWTLGIRLFKGVAKSRVYHFGSKTTGRISRNKGYYTFISKWGMTSSTLTRYFLRSAARFDGPLGAPALTWKLRLKNFFKRVECLLRKASSLQ